MTTVKRARGGLRRTALAVAVAVATPLALTGVVAAQPFQKAPYYPEDGNDGYDVQSYALDLRYQPVDDHLIGKTTVIAKPLRDLTAFSFDFRLNTTSVLVNNVPATFRREGQKLHIEPAFKVREGRQLKVVVTYDDIPSKLGGLWYRTPDGAVVANEPHGAAWWYPSNDHPSDKASFSVAIRVPDGTEAISNGVGGQRGSRKGWTRWEWSQPEPMATYQAFLAVGQYQVHTDGSFDSASLLAAPR